MKKQKRGKQYKQAKKTIGKESVAIEKAVEQVLSANYAKFPATIELKVNVNVDPKDSEQNIRFMCALPYSLGTTKKVLALGEVDESVKYKTLQVTKADETHIEKIASGKLVPKKDFDLVVADPSFMPKIAKAARVLGPKGLMPNPKTGTVGDLKKVLKDMDKGQVEVRTQPSNKVIHISLGKTTSKPNEIVENYNVVIEEIKKHKPSKVKKDLIQSAYLSTSMSPSVKVLV